MKKSLLFISASCFGILSITAQITITTADVAIPSKVIYQATDTIPTISVGSAGTSQTWNMTGLSNDKKDTLTFLSYSSAPDATFSTANLVIKQGYQNFYSYLINSTTGLTSLGNAGTNDFGAGPTAIKQINSPVEIIMTFPAMYGTSYTNNYTTTTPVFYLGITVPPGIPIDSARARSQVKKTVLIDAWGTLTTPLGTYDVIRSKEILIKHDTTDVVVFGNWNNAVQTSADSTMSYTWWANGIGFPIVSATMDSTGAVKSVQWLQSLPATVGITENVSSPEILVFPNPAQNAINISVNNSKAISIQVFDVTGKMIDNYSIDNDKAIINTSNFANGIFTFSIIGKDKSVLNRGKFTVAN